MSHDTRAGAILRAAFPEVGSDDPVSYFGSVGNVYEALSYAWLFWPRLIELHGAIFVALDGDDEVVIRERLKTPVSEQSRHWPPMPWSELVDSYNMFEVAHLFRRWREPREQFSEAHEVLVPIWLKFGALGFAGAILTERSQ